MSCISFLDTCPSQGDSESALLGKILQVLNEGGGGSGAGVTSISVNGGPAQTGAVSLTIPAGGVTSVNGDPGPAVLLDTDDIPEGAVNFYYTEARFNASFAGKTTTDLAEGANLYFTEARVRATVLTGFAAALGTITAADSVLSAFGKCEGRLAALEAGTAGPFVLRAGDTMTGALVITPSVANTAPLRLNTGTLTASTDIFTINSTWNNAAATFKGLFIDITNTTSGSGSQLVQLRVGGTERFSINKNGTISSSVTNIENVALSQSLTGASGLESFSILVTANTSASPVIQAVSVSETASGGDTKYVSYRIGPNFFSLAEKFYVLKSGHIWTADKLTVTGFASLGPSTTPSANLDVNNSTTTTLAYFYSTTDGLASPTNYARIELVPGASATEALIRSTAGGTGLVSSLPHILKVGTGPSVGTDIAAQSVAFRSGQSTGTGIRGDILFQQSAPGSTGSSANAYTTSWTINTAGALVATGGFPITAAEITLSKRISVAPVVLTDAATIATDASLSNHFRVTLGGNRTLGNPTNPVDGQRAIWEFIQDGTGSRTIAFDTKFAFGTDITGVTLTTTAAAHDLITAIYNLAADKWYIVAATHGFPS